MEYFDKTEENIDMENRKRSLFLSFQKIFQKTTYRQILHHPGLKKLNYHQKKDDP